MARWLVQTSKADVIVSSDAIREELTGDANIQDPAVWVKFHEDLRTALDAGLRVVADATFLTPMARRPILFAAAKHGITPQAHIMQVEYATAQKRNQERDRVVPDFVMERMWINYTEWCRVPKILHNEGFDVFVYSEDGGGDSIAHNHNET